MVAETVEKKIKMKIFKVPLKDHEIKDYAASKDVKLTGVSKGSFLMGEIFVDDQIYGLLGLEKEFWKEESVAPDLDYLDRITIKLFDNKGRDIGKIEERLLKELSQSIVSGTLPVFTLTLKRFPYIIDVEKESNKLVFPLLTNTSKGIFEIFEIAKKSLAMGADFTITRKIVEEKIAFINSKRGGKIEIEVYDADLAKNKTFINFLALYAGTIQFHDEIANKIKSTVKALSEGTLVLQPPKKALELMRDPRKAKQKTRDEERAERKSTKETRRTRQKRKIRGAEKDEDEDEAEEEKPKKRKSAKTKKSKSSKTLEKHETLHLKDPVKQASGVSGATAELLNRVAIISVEDLLSADADGLANILEVPSITPKKIMKWQKDSYKKIKATHDDEDAAADELDDYELLDYDFK